MYEGFAISEFLFCNKIVLIYKCIIVSQFIVLLFIIVYNKTGFDTIRLGHDYVKARPVGLMLCTLFLILFSARHFITSYYQTCHTFSNGVAQKLIIFN